MLGDTEIGINRLRCATLQCTANIAIATMTSLRHRPTTDSGTNIVTLVRRALAEVCTVPVLLVLTRPIYLTDWWMWISVVVLLSDFSVNGEIHNETLHHGIRPWYRLVGPVLLNLSYPPSTLTLLVGGSYSEGTRLVKLFQSSPEVLFWSTRPTKPGVTPNKSPVNQNLKVSGQEVSVNVTFRKSETRHTMMMKMMMTMSQFSFSCFSGPASWNSLPTELHIVWDITDFKNQLKKTYLYKLVFYVHWMLLLISFLWPPCGIGQAIIFLSCGFFLSIYLSFFLV